MNQMTLLCVLMAFTTAVFHVSVQADTFRARIVRIQGEVFVVDAQGEKREPRKKQFLVNANETVTTSENSKAVVQFDDGVMSVLDEKSSLRVEKTGWLSQLGGKIYYVFRKVLGKQKPKKVKTSFATIGIRGTTFIVDASENNQQVALQEGKLNIESPGDDFALVSAQQLKDDFESFKQQQQQHSEQVNQAFDDYKQQLSQEFIEYKKRFDLEANHVVSFDNNRVNRAELNPQWNQDFTQFADFSRDYLDAYIELDRATAPQQ